MAKLSFVNNDTTVPVVGDIVRSSGQNFGAVLALADSTAHAEGILGVWADSPKPGYSGTVNTDGVVEVNCTESVIPGERLYLSAATAGKATKTAPAIPVSIGIVLSVELVNAVYKASVQLIGNSLTPAKDVAIAGLTGGTTTLDSVVDSATRKAVNADEKTAVAALADLTEGEIPIKNGTGGFDGEPALALTNKGDMPVGGGGTSGILVMPAPADGCHRRAKSSTIYGFEDVLLPTLAKVSCPVFSAGAASVAMGTLKASLCEVESARTLAENSTITLSTTDAVAGPLLFVCRALALGYTLAIKNGGAGNNVLETIPASLTVPRAYLLSFDGTNYVSWGPYFVEGF